MAEDINPNRPSTIDILSVKSRVSWAAIFAGAMVALSIYVLLTMLGVALGLEAATQGAEFNIGFGTALYSIVTMLIAFFFGGWAASRLAVGESKLEAVLYGVILWGLLFLGLVWLVSAGVRAGYGGMLGIASGVYSADGQTVSVDSLTADLERAGVPQDQVDLVRGYYDKARSGELADVAVDVTERNREEILAYSRSASWWSLLGIVISMATAIVGSLIGSGDLPSPVPILGVQRRVTTVRTGPGA